MKSIPYPNIFLTNSLTNSLYNLKNIIILLYKKLSKFIKNMVNF